MSEKKIARGTTATRKIKKHKQGKKTVIDYKCDLVKLAKEYSNWGNIPRYLGDKRAMEIALLAVAYLKLKGKP